MQRQDSTPATLVELGTASTVTRGPTGDMIEVAGLWRRIPFDAG